MGAAQATTVSVSGMKNANPAYDYYAGTAITTAQLKALQQYFGTSMVTGALSGKDVLNLSNPKQDALYNAIHNYIENDAIHNYSVTVNVK